MRHYGRCVVETPSIPVSSARRSGDHLSGPISTTRRRALAAARVTGFDRCYPNSRDEEHGFCVAIRPLSLGTPLREAGYVPGDLLRCVAGWVLTRFDPAEGVELSMVCV